MDLVMVLKQHTYVYNTRNFSYQFVDAIVADDRPGIREANERRLVLHFANQLEKSVVRVSLARVVAFDDVQRVDPAAPLLEARPVRIFAERHVLRALGRREDITIDDLPVLRRLGRYFAPGVLQDSVDKDDHQGGQFRAMRLELRRRVVHRRDERVVGVNTRTTGMLTFRG